MFLRTPSNACVSEVVHVLTVGMHVLKITDIFEQFFRLRRFLIQDQVKCI